jgi:hypothetical protein
MAVVELPRHFDRINFSFPIRCWLISYVPDLGPLHRTTVIGDAPRSGACSVFAPGRTVELMREEVHEGADFRREWLLFRKYRGDDVPFGLEGAKDFDELAPLEARMSIVIRDLDDTQPGGGRGDEGFMAVHGHEAPDWHGANRAIEVPSPELRCSAPRRRIARRLPVR